MISKEALPFPEATKSQAVVLVLASSLTIMGSVMIAALIPKMITEFSASTPYFNTLLPLVITGPALAIAFFSPCVGWLIDQFGRKFVLIFATIAYALLGTLPAFLHDFSYITISRILFGLTEASIMVACSTLIADYWKDEARARFINFQVIAIGIVGAIFFTAGGILGEHSWKLPFYLYLLPILLVPFMIKYLWEPQHQSSTVGHKVIIGNFFKKSDIKILIFNCLLIFFCMILAFIVPVQTPLLLTQLSIQSTTLIGLSAGLGLLSSLCGSLIWPILRKKFQTQGVNIILLGLVAVGLYLLTQAHNYQQILFAVFIHGIGVGMMVPNMMLPVMNAVHPSHRGKMLGLFTSSLYLGQFLSPVLISILIEGNNTLNSAISIFALLTVIILIMLFLLTFFRKTPAEVN